MKQLTLNHNLTSLTEQIKKVLQDVKDPEIPSISLVELGMLHDIIVEDNRILIKMIPTFLGCPALEIISRDVEKAITEKLAWVEAVQVEFVLEETWTTDRISSEGREKLKEYGISPPPARHKEGEPWAIDCPYCGSTFTTLENIFGPTACRSILYCRSCKNPFEAMKPVSTL